MLVFALLFGGYSYNKNNKAQNSNTNEEKVVEDFLDDLSDDEQAIVNGAIKAQEQFNQLEEYYFSSILMNMNAAATNKITLQYVIKSDYVVNINNNIAQDYTGNLMEAYELHAVGNEVNQAIIKEYPDQLTEKELNTFLTSTYTNQTLTISLRGLDKDMCEKMAECVKNSMKDYYNTLNTKVGAHELELVNETYSCGYDNVISTAQSNTKTLYSNLSDKLTATMDRLSDKEKSIVSKAVDIADDGDQANTNNTTTTNTNKKSGFQLVSKKYVVFGAFIGIAFLAFLRCVMYLLSTKIKSADEIEEMFDSEIIGEINLRQKKLNPIDQSIENVQYKLKKFGSIDENIDYVATKVSFECNRAGIKSLFITGNTEDDNDIINRLIAELNKEDITCKIGKNLCTDPNSVKEISEYDSTLFIETIDESKYEELAEQFNFCRNQHINVLGMIILYND